MAHVDADFTLLEMAPQRWKTRMQLAAPRMAQRVTGLLEQGKSFDAVLCSSMVDLACLRSCLQGEGVRLPFALYFHENQFAYPSQQDDPSMFQFAALNFTSGLAADSIAFNSSFNCETFLLGVSSYLRASGEKDMLWLLDALKKKSRILSPGIDFTRIDEQAKECGYLKKEPIIVWNHRWEHDKNPETFFHALFALAKQGILFQLIVLGEQFRDGPAIFSKARQRLADRILHIGFVDNDQEYAKWLCQATHVVSTARHEFFGISVMEGVRAGCIPLVPDRLSYRELFPLRFRYRQGNFLETLRRVLTEYEGVRNISSKELTEQYSWHQMGPKYGQWLHELSCSSAGAL
jgi:glycosyltransferase involved in cell wall biosynthesis